VLYEEHNQYHEVNDYLVDIFVPAARGEYIAFCEGDDYWINDHKLQYQYDFLEAHPDYSFFFHNAIIDDYDAGLKYRSSPETEDRDRTLDELIVSGGGLANCTGSFFFRKAAIKDPLPFLRVAVVGDYPWMFTLGLRGKVRWGADPMLVYRHGRPGSWTENNRSSLHSKISRSTHDLATLEQFEEDTGRACTASIQRRATQAREALSYDSRLLAACERELSLGEIWRDSSSSFVRKLRFSLARVLSPALYKRVADAFDRRLLRGQRTPEALRESAWCEERVRAYREAHERCEQWEHGEGSEGSERRGQRGQRGQREAHPCEEAARTAERVDQ
jgi:hypothetical protein